MGKKYCHIEATESQAYRPATIEMVLKELGYKEVHRIFKRTGESSYLIDKEVLQRIDEYIKEAVGLEKGYDILEDEVPYHLFKSIRPYSLFIYTGSSKLIDNLSKAIASIGMQRSNELIKFISSRVKNSLIRLDRIYKTALMNKDITLSTAINKVLDIESLKAQNMDVTGFIANELEILDLILSDEIPDEILPSVLSAIAFDYRMEFLDLLFNTDSYLERQHIPDNMHKFIKEFVDHVFENNPGLKELETRYFKLNSALQDKFVNIIKNIVLSAPAVKKSPSLRIWIEQNLNEELKKDTNFYDKWFLGLGSDDNMILQILNIHRNKVRLREVSKTKGVLDDFLNTWKKVKDLKKDGKRLHRLLFQKDYNGKMLPELVNIWFMQNPVVENIKKQWEKKKRAYIEAFIQSDGSNTEGKLRDLLNFERRHSIKRLNILKLSRVKEWLEEQGFDEFLQYMEVDTVYEDELEYKYDKELLEIFVEKQIRLLEHYLSGEQDVLDRYNPFEVARILFSDMALNEKIRTLSGMSLDYLQPILPFDKINPDLLELVLHPDLRRLYIIADMLVNEYIIPTLNSEGFNLKENQLFVPVEPALRNLMEAFGMFKGIKLWAKTWLYKNIFSELYVKSSDYDKDFHYKLSSDTFLSDAYKRLMGVELSQFKNTDISGQVENLFSDNLFEIIREALFLSASIKERKEMLRMSEIAEKIFYQYGTENALNKLKGWRDRNIYGIRFPVKVKLFDKLLKLPKWLQISPSSITIYRAVIEELVNKAIERLNQEGSISLDIIKIQKLDENEYKIYSSFTPGKYEIVTLDKVTNIIRDHYDTVETEEPEEVTVTRILSYAMGLYVFKVLGLNPVTGIKNRLAGYLRNRITAVSGRYGYREEHIKKARRFLSFTNTLKYLGQIPVVKVYAKRMKKYKNMETLKQFADQFDIFQNKADELAKEGKYNALAPKLTSALKEFLFDFSINNPEWHNQSENILAVMMTTYIKDIDGNEHPLFDGEDFVWKPGTLNLKPKFRTKENIKNWELFELNEEGLNMLLRIESAIYGNQGNYKHSDRPLLNNNIVGTLASMFVRWVFEIGKTEYGGEKLDIRTGKHVKGIRTYMLDSFVLTTTFYLSKAGFSLFNYMAAGVIFGVNMLSLYSIPAAIPVASSIGLVAYSIYRFLKHERKELDLELKNAYKSGYFLVEGIGRLIDLPIEFLTMEKFNLTGKIRDKISNNINLLQEDVDRIRELSQEWATSVFRTMNYLVLYYMALYMLNAMSYGDDEDDSEERAIREKLLRSKIMDLLDFIDSFGDDVRMFDNPYTAAKRVMDRPSAAIFIKSTFIDPILITSERINNEVSDKQYIDKLIHKSGFVPIPKILSRQLIDDESVEKRDIIRTGEPLYKYLIKRNKEGVIPANKYLKNALWRKKRKVLSNKMKGNGFNQELSDYILSEINRQMNMSLDYKDSREIGIHMEVADRVIDNKAFTSFTNMKKFESELRKKYNLNLGRDMRALIRMAISNVYRTEEEKVRNEKGE